MLRDLFLWAIASILIWPTLYGQHLNFKTYKIQDGLPQSTIWAIHEDSRGYLWLGTYGGGISQFDGLVFKNYNTSDGLSNDLVQDIIEDQHGNIWIGTHNGGINIFNNKDFKILTTKDGLPSNTITALFLDSNGLIWISTENGLCKYDGNSFESFTTKDGLSSNLINVTFEDSRGVIWIGTSTGVNYYSDNKINTYGENIKALKSGVADINEDKDGNILIGTLGAGLVKSGIDTINISIENDLLNNRINKILVRGDDVWIATGNGVSNLHGGEIHHFNSDNGLPKGEILNIKFDNSGNLWMSINGVGLCRYAFDGFQYYTSESGLIGKSVYTIFEKAPDQYLLGTDRGLSLIKNNSISNFDSQFPSENCFHISKSFEGNYWMATASGFIKYDGNDFYKNPSAPIYHMSHLNNGTAWLTFNAGIIEIPQIDSLNFENYKYTHHNKKIGFTNSSSTVTLIDTSKNVWIATYNDGLFMYNNHKFKQFTTANGLISNLINCMIKDQNGNIWIGTSNGLSYFDGNYFKNYSVENGLISTKINSLLFENDSTLWIGGSNGLDRLFLNEKNEIKSAQTYKLKEGVIGQEVVSTISLKASNGTLWFGTIEGAISINPKKLAINTTEPVTNIVDIKLFFEHVDWKQYTDSLTAWFGLPINLELPYDKNHLTFIFNGVSKLLSEKNQYQWKLEGFEKNWSPPSKIQQVTYSNIPYGNYSFMVKASNNDGIWDKNPVVFNFKITPPIWLRWWFILGICSLITLFIFYMVRHQIKKIEIRESIKRKMIEMELIALRAQMSPHFIFNTMNSIQHYVKKKDTESALFFISKFSRLMRMILEHSAVEMIKIDDEVTILSTYLDLEQMRSDNKFKYNIIIGEDIDGSYDKIPSMILQPYIENAIWHGIMNKDDDDGKITVELNRKKGYLVCSIQDNGIGRDKAKSIRSKHSTYNKSYGMLITSERLKLLNSERHQEMSVRIIDLKDDKEKALGTRIEVLIKIEEEI